MSTTQHNTPWHCQYVKWGQESWNWQPEIDKCHNDNTKMYAAINFINGKN